MQPLPSTTEPGSRPAGLWLGCRIEAQPTGWPSMFYTFLFLLVIPSSQRIMQFSCFVHLEKRPKPIFKKLISTHLFICNYFFLESKKAAKHLVAASGHLRKAPRPEGGGSEGGPEREGLKPDLNRSSRQGAGGLGVSLSLSFPSVSSRLF